MTLQEALRKLFVYQSHGLGAVRRPLSEQEAVACAAWIDEHTHRLGSLLQEITYRYQRLGRPLTPQVSLATLGKPQNLLGLAGEILLRCTDAADWDAWAGANADHLLSLLLAALLCDRLDARGLKKLREHFPWPEGLLLW